VAVNYRESLSPSSSYDHAPPYYEPPSSSSSTKTKFISDTTTATSKINTAGATGSSSSSATAAVDVTNETPTKRSFDRPIDRSSTTKTQFSTPAGHDLLLTESKSQLNTAAATTAVVQESVCANHLTSSIDHNNSMNSHPTKTSMLLSDEHKAANLSNQDVCNKHGLEKCVLCTMFNTTSNTTNYFGAVELGGYSSSYSGGHSHKAQNYFINNNNSNNNNSNSNKSSYYYSKPSTLAPINYNESINPSVTTMNPSATNKNTPPPSSSPSSSSLLLRGTNANIATAADDLCRKHSLQDCVLCGMLRPPVVQTKRNSYDIIQPSDNYSFNNHDNQHYNNGVGHQDNASVKYHQQHNPSSRMQPTMNSTLNAPPPSSIGAVVQNSHHRHQLLQIHQELQLPNGDVNMYNSTYSAEDYNNNDNNIHNNINNNDNSSLMNNSYNSISSLNQNSITSLNSNASGNNNSYNNIIMDHDNKNNYHNNNNKMIDPLQQHLLDDQFSHSMISEDESFIQKAITSHNKMISIPAKTPKSSHSKYPQPSIEFVSSIDSLDSSTNYGSNSYYHLRKNNDINENKNIYHVNNSSVTTTIKTATGGSSAQVRNVKAIAQSRQHQNHRNDNDQYDCEITYNADGICNNHNSANNNNYNNYSANSNNYSANNYNENYNINNINSSHSKIQVLQQMQRKSVNNNANISSNQAAALLPRSSSSPLPKSSSSFQQMMLDHDDHSHRSGLVIKAHHNRSQNPTFDGNADRMYDITEFPPGGSTALGSKIVYIDDDDGYDVDGGGGVDYREDDGENYEAGEDNYDDDDGGGGNTAAIPSSRNHSSAVADSENNQVINDKVTVKKKKKVKRKKKAAVNTIAGILSSHKATTGGVVNMANHHLQSIKRRPLK
jgi:hypothetical protein